MDTALIQLAFKRLFLISFLQYHRFGSPNMLDIHYNYYLITGLGKPLENSKYGDNVEGQQELWETIPIIYRYLI